MGIHPALVMAACALFLGAAIPMGSAGHLLETLIRNRDHELETFVRMDGRAARELRLDEESKERSPTLVQVTDGRRIIHSIFDSTGVLVDCDIVEAPEAVEDFMVNFNDSTQPLHPKSIVSTRSFTQPQGRPTRHQRELLNFHKQRKKCLKLHGKTSQQRKRRNKSSGVNRRGKRSLIFPGTNWCGKGNQAEFVADFGEKSTTDRCCQEHDGCPYIIEGLTRRYNYFNYRLHTLSFCLCDEKFHQCLKDANSGAANIIGKVYFNVMNSQCFQLERERVCANWSWWGACNRKVTRLVAQPRSSEPY